MLAEGAVVIAGTPRGPGAMFDIAYHFTPPRTASFARVV
jgi:hypothetical protein